MIDFLLKTYLITKWPMFLVVELKNLGVFELELAKQMVEEGRIVKRRGMQGTLIELVPNKFKEELKMNKKKLKKVKMLLWNDDETKAVEGEVFNSFKVPKGHTVYQAIVNGKAYMFKNAKEL